MRKKITMLLASLFVCMGAMKADVTDLPQMSTDGDIKWYTIKNTRSGKYANYAGDAVQMTQESAMSVNSLFYFTAVDGEVAEGFTSVKIHAFMTENLLSHYNSWTAEGVTWYLHEDTKSETPAGLHITKATNLTGWNALNDANRTKITDYYSQDAGSIFVIESVEAATVTELVNAYLLPIKDAAKAELEKLSSVSVFYPTETTDAVNAINEVVVASNSLEDLDFATGRIKTIVADYRNAAYQALEGKYFAFKPAERTTYIAMGKDHADGDGTTDLNRPAQLWQFVYDNGAVNLYNPYTGKYLGAPASSSAAVPVVDEQANAGDYALNVAVEGFIALQVGGATAHVDGYYDLVRWDDSAAGASKFTFEEVKDFSSIISSYKTVSTTTLDSWATLSVVFDAALINAAKTAINGIATTDWATFAAIDAELKKVTDAVAAKMLTFQTIATDDGRVNVWISANASTMKAFGAAKDAQDHNAVWSLQHAGGSSFYLYNELNKVYLGAPVNNIDAVVLTEAPAAAYTLEMITDKGDNVVELHSNGGTLHASNHPDKKLISWDGNEDASRWMVNVIDITKDIRDLLATIENDDYAEVPALGQYTTAAYDALVEASNTATTVAQVAEAIAAFKASLNRPVYFITSAWDGGYSAGSAIYYDGTWRWKTANIYDRQMWMTIPSYANADVPVVDAYDANGTSYEICDYLTGTVMRGKSVQIVKIANWEGAYSLQYNADGTSDDAAQHAQSGGALVNWKPALVNDCQASAWHVEYIGNSYDLDKLTFTDEQISALTALQPAYDAKAYAADAEVGEGLGQYQGDKNAIVTALNAGKAILDKSLVEQAALDVDAINSATENLNNASDLTLNMPVQGKYYRIKSVNSNNYVTAPANTGTAMTLIADASANNILYWDAEGHLLVYGTGYYINGKNHAHLGYKDTYAVEGSKTGVIGAYTIKPGNANYWHDNGASLDVYQGATHANCNWTIEEVTTLPVTITEAGYATFYAPVEVTLPDGVTAHTVTANGEWATLSEAISVVPAENGVILAGEADIYNFTITNTGAADLENALAGTVAKTLVAKTEGDAYYVLAKKDENVGLYNPVKGDDEANFYNASHKAYWHIPAAPQSAGYRFGEGTTSVDNVELTNDNVVIYDLAGRRVEKMEKGIYIVNGKKVIK